MLTLTSTYPSQTIIDGQVIRLRVARLTVTEATAFRRAHTKFTNSEAIRLVSTRKEGAEMEKRPVPRARTADEISAAEALERFDSLDLARDIAFKEAFAVIDACRALVPAEPIGEAFVIPDDEIRRRRFEEMTPADRAAFDELDAREDAANDLFLADAIERYITVETGQIEEDGKAITAGADLVRLFAFRADILTALMETVRIENGLSEAKKKDWRLLFDSFASSTAPATDPAGSAPAPIAAPAEPKAFASSADAMAASVTA